MWTVSDEPYLPTAIYVRRRWNPLPSLIRWAACCCYALSDMYTLTFNTGVIHVLYFFRLSEVLWLVLLGIYLGAGISVRSDPYFSFYKKAPSYIRRKDLKKVEQFLGWTLLRNWLSQIPTQVCYCCTFHGCRDCWLLPGTFCKGWMAGYLTMSLFSLQRWDGGAYCGKSMIWLQVSLLPIVRWYYQLE